MLYIERDCAPSGLGELYREMLVRPKAESEVCIMFHVGIDIAKRKHCMSVIGDGGEVIVKGFMFANTTEGFKHMLEALATNGVACNNAKVCMESTGHYGRALKGHFELYGFEVNEINPILTANWRKTQSVRKVKNDAVDAVAIAQWARASLDSDQIRPSKDREELKSLARSRTFQSQIISDCKRKATAILDEVFPEFCGFFSDNFGKTAMAVLKRWPSAKAIAGTRIDVLTNCMAEASRNKFGRSKAEELKALAKDSFALTSKDFAQAFQLKQLIAHIEFLSEQLDELDKELAVLLAEANTTITTIPGIGKVCGATILGEIGDIECFDHSSQLVAFAGYDPSVYESGKFKGTKNHISKRGSRYLRWALWVAADRARKFDPVFKAFYEKKRAEGKPHKVAVCAVARKLCNTIFAVLNNNVPYVVQEAQ